MPSVATIVDYGVGNLHSVARAFEHIGAKVEVTSDTQSIIQAERLVLPGVGAFGHCMDELNHRQLIEPILKFAESGRPFLGICVGMQIMLSTSEEFGEHKGLGLIAGRVRNLALRKDWIASSPEAPRSDNKKILPVIGWMSLTKTKDWQGTILEGAAAGNSVYFVHSFEANPDDKATVIAQYEYDGINITAAIGKDNLTGVQFHPEKSGLVGINMLKWFVGH